MISGKEIEREVMISQALPQYTRIAITPFSHKQVNPNSYDLRLHNELLVYEGDLLDLAGDNATKTLEIPGSGMTLEKGKFYLGRTFEYTVTKDYIPRISAKSSLLRLGLQIQTSGGQGDVGFSGYWTLLIAPLIDVIIYPGIKIAEIAYEPIFGAHELYQGLYNKNQGAEASKFHQTVEV